MIKSCEPNLLAIEELLLVWLLSLVGIFTSRAQSSLIDTAKHFNVVYLSEFYKEKGIIFGKDYLVSIDMSDRKDRFTPTPDDINRTEAVFMDKYDQLRKKNVDVKAFFQPLALAVCWVN